MSRPGADDAPPPRSVPYNANAEMETLGSVLIDPLCLPEIIEQVGLEASDFFRAAHGQLWQNFLDLHAAGFPIDIASVEELVGAARFKQMGGIGFFESLMWRTPHAGNAVYMAGVVKEKARLRLLIDCCNETLTEIGSATLPSPALAERMGRRVMDVLSVQAVGGEGCKAQRALTDLYRRKEMERRAGHPGLLTGWSEFDSLTQGGLKRKNLILIGARPSMGKTAVALNLAASVAESGRHVLFASLEMDAGEIMDRLACMYSGMSSDALAMPGRFTPADEASVGRALSAVDALPLHVDDTSTQTVSHILACASRIRAAHGDLALVVADYAQLIEPDPAIKDRREQVSDISRRLKQLARILNVPVVLCCQLNRSADNRENKRPRLSDLRETGQFEQDADLALLLFRESYYDAAKDDATVEVIVAKNRNGRVGSFKLGYDRARHLVTDLTAAAVAGSLPPPSPPGEHYPDDGTYYPPADESIEPRPF